jgi:hypothetical protein
MSDPLAAITAACQKYFETDVVFGDSESLVNHGDVYVYAYC